MSKGTLLAFVALLASLGLSGCGGGGAEENIPGATASDATAPSVPTGLTATAASSSQINLSWAGAVAAATNVTEYEVYRDGTLIAILGTVTTYIDTGLAAFTTYIYTVRAVGGNGKKSGHSNPATGTTAPDTTEPVISNGQPNGILASGTTQTTMSVTTNENATCRWGTTNVAYGSLPNTFTTTGSTSHSTTLNGLADGQSYTRYVRCQDGANPPNANASSTAISFSVANAPDTTPPVISNGQPSGILASGTTQTTMSVTTNENATCRWGTTNVAYGSLPNTFTTTGSTSHSTTLNGLADGQSYTRYVRCQDGANPPNANASSTAISFSVANAPDTTEPVISNGQPNGILASGTTQTTMSVTTNENATCRWGTTNVAYGSLPNTFTTTGSTSHSTTLNGLADGQSYTRYVRCQDGANPPNANASSTAISFSVANAPDTTPPVISNGQPSGILASGTTQTTMSVTTNENATCRWGTTNVAYGSLPNTFTTTGSTSHSTTLNGLADGQSYTRYVRCQDGANPPNANASSTAISFSVANAPDTTEPVISGGAPTGTLAAGTTQVTMSVSTNENATCKWDTSAATSYAAMLNTFTTAGGAFHSTQLTGLVNGQSYTRYVRCQDGANNANTSSYTVSFSVGTGAGPISLSLVPSRTAGAAPLAVFFDATGTTGTASRPFHDIEYRWDFGDPAGGATWSRGSRAGISSKNSATGPVAAHVFETPGTYTVTLTAFDGTNTDTTTISITVDDPDVVFAGTGTVCVSTTSGGTSFDGCPAGGMQVTSTNLGSVITTYGIGGTRLLFRRGHTWTSSSPLSIRSNSSTPRIIGSFGPGATTARLSSTQTSFDTFIGLSHPSTPNFGDVRIMDLEIEAGGRNVDLIGAAGRSTRITLLRLNLHDAAANGVVFSEYVASGQGAHFTEIAVVDSTIANTGGYSSYFGANKSAFLGNSMTNPGTGVGVFRTQYFTKSVMSNNTIGGSPAGFDLMRLAAPKSSGGPAFYDGLYTESSVVSDNLFDDRNGHAAWALQTGPENSGQDERVRDIIIERNWFRAGTSTEALLMHFASATTIRNNLFDLSNGHNGSNDAVSAIRVDRRGIEPVPDLNHIYNNTVYRSDGFTGPNPFAAINLRLGTNMVVKNNLGYTPNIPNSTVLLNNATGTVASNNSTDAQQRFISPNFAVTPPTTPAHYKPICTSSYPCAQGISVPVWSDFFRAGQPSPRDIGAVNH